MSSIHCHGNQQDSLISSLIMILNLRPDAYEDFVQKYPGFCTMGYISPALPPGHGWVADVDHVNHAKQELEVQLIFYTEIDD